MDLQEIKVALRGLSGDKLQEVLAEFTGQAAAVDRDGFLAELTALSERDDRATMDR